MPELAATLPRPAAAGLCVHEWALLALGCGTLGALAATAGPLHPVGLEVGLATALYAVAVGRLRGPASVSQRLRSLAACAYVLWFYLAVGRMTPALGTPLRDAELYALDRAVLGGTPAVLWQSYSRFWLTELLSAGYLSYHVYLIVALARALFQPAGYLYRLAAPVVSAFAAGLLGYLLVPAVGPAKALAEDFATPLTGGILTQINDTLVSRGSSVYDVFPSLHVLITCVLLDHDWRAARRRFWVMLVPAGLLFASTLYLRYHYAVDLAAGLAFFLALAGWRRAGRWRGARATGDELRRTGLALRAAEDCHPVAASRGPRA